MVAAGLMCCILSSDYIASKVCGQGTEGPQREADKGVGGSCQHQAFLSSSVMGPAPALSAHLPC